MSHVHDAARGPVARPGRRRARGLVILAAVLGAVLLVPVPWLHVISDDPPGSAWRLDGRLQVGGTTVNPPGRWSWLAVGRPQLLGEALVDRIAGTDAPPIDLRAGSVTMRPALNEPAAAAVGLRHAGIDVPLGLLVEARAPKLDGYPERAVIASVDGVPLTDRQTWERVSAAWEQAIGPEVEQRQVANPEPSVDGLRFRLPDGREYSAPGPGLPYGVVRTLDLAPEGLEAGITFAAAKLVPADWFRNLSLGTSHGLMVALTTYAQASGENLAQGRHIAGTGGIRGDGAVTRVSGVPAKARAANRAGAEVLFVPATQAHELDPAALPGTTLVPVDTLAEAIEWLSVPVT